MPKPKDGNDEPKRRRRKQAKRTEKPVEEEPVVVRDKRAPRDGLGMDDEADETKAEPVEEKATAAEEAAEPEPEAQPEEPAEEPEPPEAEPAPEGPQEPASVYGMLALFFQMLSQQAWVSLGVRADPYTSQLAANLEEAELAIDTLGYLQKKMAGKLSDDEARMVEGELANLRINFVQRRSQ
jgi:hypothetical protein